MLGIASLHPTFHRTGIMIIKNKIQLIVILVTSLLLTACDQSSFTDTNGNTVRLSSKDGQWMVLNLWAEWCDPCRDEVPELNAMADSGLARVVGVDFDGSAGNELKQKIKELGITFPVVKQSPLETLQVGTPQALPATYLITPEGKVAKTLFGPQTKESLELNIKILQEKMDND